VTSQTGVPCGVASAIGDLLDDPAPGPSVTRGGDAEEPHTAVHAIDFDLGARYDAVTSYTNSHTSASSAVCKGSCSAVGP
jgi:hypothetical protein